MSGRPAVFLDRDGTIIEERGYLRDPVEVRLIPGSAAALRRLNHAGFPAIIVTNQSGIARGLLTEAEYAASTRRLDELLALEHARIDASYHCPHLPEISGPCGCRKPGTLLYERAAGDLGLDLRRSWWIGDRLRDVEAAEAFGGRGMLVLTGYGRVESNSPAATALPTAEDLAAAVQGVLGAE
ncbi:MAG TPA: HAD family hydrolase [Gemmatimonadales bacterium]|nr:HAD family hydrolase [Gemmatimonadales bacterium]